MNAHIRTLMPFACPKGMDPRTWRQTIEKELNALFDKATALITALDIMDADSEDYEDGEDAEPSLGWCSGYGPGNTLDLEADDSDHEDGGDDEHSLGWTEDGSQTGYLGCFGSLGDDHEPSLGWTKHIDQRLSGRETEKDWHVLDGEEDAGDMAEVPAYGD
ncbi:hypothetical protein EN814_18915 [Mesorhizobium sp. M2D.F.Ca.ET.171.01.1.1]|uniref:hypothetical protein n=1 Tax=unclassified Mesorhizobium TaxID=325217 RepID=UPI001091FFB6|nr:MULTISPECIES: hypothetical protein [unclassified Mesorhizobium]TGS94775.1 hypothetical protein EN821_18930 [Mesorhizobium sp. M2D.F.Ca.ET.178.01.1.1]TGT10557.1 hypothetical protein EN814_18915 [Mesorhizobium sp. M2D.F.Ca.ET.171.01.1.1]